MSGTVPPEVRNEMAIPSYMHRHPLVRWLVYYRVRVLGAAIARLAPGRALDFGCGTGVLLPALAETCDTVYATDLETRPATALAARLRLMNVHILPTGQWHDAVPDHSLDLIVAAEVLEHIGDLAPLTAQFGAKLARDGRLLVSVPTENRFYRFGRKVAGFREGLHIWNAAQIEQHLKDQGWICERGTGIPVPGPLALYRVVEMAVSKS
jgi:SAM-dependent methyltransferase